jgi:hypothetical protein
MEERTDTQRKPKGTNYRLNVIQIPLLRGLGSLVLCLYVLLYELLDPQPFSLSHYLVFAGMFAAYCFGSWFSRFTGRERTKAFSSSSASSACRIRPTRPSNAF